MGRLMVYEILALPSRITFYIKRPRIEALFHVSIRRHRGLYLGRPGSSRGKSTVKIILFEAHTAFKLRSLNVLKQRGITLHLR